MQRVKYLTARRMLIKHFREFKFIKLPVRTVSYCFWLWFYNLFNRVDEFRLQKVGPDRCCAEWVLKNGGSVKFKVQNNIISDYNDLPPEGSSLTQDQLIEIYAKEASLNNYGFHHFKNCNHISKIVFISCKLVGDTGLERLQLYLNNSLRHLEIKSSYAITDKGILLLTGLRNLQYLSLHDLKGIKEKEKCAVAIKEALKNTECDINF